MLGAVKHPEPDPESAAHADIGFGKKHRSVVGAPPAGDAVRRRQGIEDDRGAGRDPGRHERQGTGFHPEPHQRLLRLDSAKGAALGTHHSK